MHCPTSLARRTRPQLPALPRIPQSFAVQAKVAAGTAVDMAVESGRLIVRPVRRQHRLRDLLKGITARNQHAEIHTGRRVGRESW